MKLYIIAVKNDYGDSPWVVSAWDEYTIDDNPTGFEEDLEKQRASNGVDNVAVGIVHVSDSFLDKLFLPRETTATSEEKMERAEV